METVSLSEAKKKVSKILNQVASGKSFSITKHGRPIAILQPVNPTRRRSKSEAIDHLKKIRKEFFLRGLSIRELIQEGRK